MMNGGSTGRVSHPGSRSRSKGTGGSFERVPGDEEESMSGEEEDEGSQSVYSDDEEEDDESSYESDLNTSKESTHQTFNIAKKETNRVRVWRTVLSAMLVITAGVVIVTTYVFLADNEDNEFQSTFDQAALTISDSMRFNYNKMLDALTSRSEAVTSLTLTAGLRWPFVTIPHFEIRGERAREETRSETYGFSPIVNVEDKDDWETYSVANQNWILQGRGIDVEDPANQPYLPTTPIIPPKITFVDPNATGESRLLPYPDGPISNSTPDTPFAVNWQMSPIPSLTYTINLNLRSSDHYRHLIQVLLDSQDPVLSDFTDLGKAYYETVLPEKEHQRLHESYVGTSEGRYYPAKDRPHSVLMAPIFNSFINGSQAVVGMLWVVVPWDWQLAGLLPQGTKVVDVVLDNSCGTTYTYEVRGPEAIFKGPGDQHETEFTDMGYTSSFAMQPIVKAYDPTMTEGATVILNGENYTLCEYKIHVYPTKEMKADYDTGRPETFAIIMAAIFLITGMVFLIFVRYVQQRQDMVMATAIRTSAIVSSLFPANVRERIMKDAEEQGRMDLMGGKARGGNWRLRNGGKENLGPKSKLEDFIGVEAIGGGGGGGIGGFGEEHDAFKSKPIADLFPDATVLFADLVGFTAWSSEREPTQVFQLLETLYHAFDQIARKRRVFKVETIGDCYVAVTGLPEPRKDHAIAMARFARDCMTKMKVLVVKLEVPLGPGTADLSMRFGLHSGPVTAGVLRGEKSRFQLFGDTVNTAARMESNGAKERVHVSQETADLIQAANKSHWLTPREDKIHAKGKGELQTYWLEIRRDNNASGTLSDNESESSDYSDFTEEASSYEEDVDGEIVLDERSQRLVDWTVDQLSRLLKQILARRKLLGIEANPEIAQRQVLDFSEGGTVIDEVADVVQLLPFDPRTSNLDDMLDDITLSAEALSQLRDFVATIATLHNDNQFHNLSHATHVTMSVVKLLSRIIAADDPRKHYTGDGSDDSDMDQEAIDQRLHEQSYGIRSDPLAQFAVVFSALLHDVDHPGVTNAELIKEGAKVAETYNNKSISEQNSVDLAWYLFMDDRYCDLRGVIYHDEDELMRFRQLVVNAVIATDIADKNLKVLRDVRWENAFSEGSSESNQEIINRKATVMIDCLLQASDIAHTMQHWHIYRKWNEFLFRELYVAFLQGRCAKNPAEFWYDGEIGFFDFYIIPLAKKLADCGVFGVSSDEYLNYARKNRNEWETRGRQIVEEYIENAKDLHIPESAEEESLLSEYEQSPRRSIAPGE